ncbi:unnamed protein product [Linum trigynum]|uniref:DUF538 domain-containing protein n=1 Tax=Linum trigynum TaxID=586398 RepID=A0AAV2DJT1_9ROSI
MAAKLQLPFLINVSLFCFISLSLSVHQGQGLSEIHDLLPQYGFPVGLLPDGVESYTLSPSDGTFTVRFTTPCDVRFAGYLVHYDKEIGGKLSKGAVRDVSGITTKQAFFWLSLSAIEVSGDGDIEFFVGPFSKKLPVKAFEKIPQCQKKQGVGSLDWRPLLGSI